jgi:selenide,water dikinase
VLGDGPEDGRLLRQTGAQAGDDLLLGQAIGTGVVLAADMQGRATSDWVRATHEAMQHTNATAGRLAQTAGVHAATDVTGFGLAGHLTTLLEDTNLVARLDRGAVPLLPGARTLWDLGLRSTAHRANRAGFLERLAGAEAPDEAWLFDPQTSGGLLLAVAPETTKGLVAAFEHAGEPPLTRIGTLVEREPAAAGPRLRIEIVDRI